MTHGLVPVLQVQGVHKSFRIPSVRRSTVREHVLSLFRPARFETLKVLDDVNLDVRQGQTVGIMGRNGCGKSTLLKILCGIYPADEGKVTVRGAVTPVLELGVGWNPELDAVDNILLLGTVMGFSLREARAQIGPILEFAEIERFANVPMKYYSSGMAARLAYSVAFAAAREILVLDEIFAVGDASFRARCEERYRQLSAAGRTVLIVSHDPRIISQFCDRAILLDEGRVVLEASGSAVSEAYLQRLRVETASSVPEGRARA